MRNPGLPENSNLTGSSGLSFDEPRELMVLGFRHTNPRHIALLPFVLLFKYLTAPVEGIVFPQF